MLRKSDLSSHVLDSVAIYYLRLSCSVRSVTNGPGKQRLWVIFHGEPCSSLYEGQHGEWWENWADSQQWKPKHFCTSQLPNLGQGPHLSREFQISFQPRMPVGLRSCTPADSKSRVDDGLVSPKKRPETATERGLLGELTYRESRSSWMDKTSATGIYVQQAFTCGNLA